MINTEMLTASTQASYQITKADLPLSCPLPTMRLWDAHPRVFLPIEKTGSLNCPYCGAKFTLVDFEPQSNIDKN